MSSAKMVAGKAENITECLLRVDSCKSPHTASILGIGEVVTTHVRSGASFPRGATCSQRFSFFVDAVPYDNLKRVGRVLTHGRSVGTAVALHAMRLLVAVALSFATLGTPTVCARQSTVDRVRTLIEEVRATSFPELAGAEIQIREFSSSSDYFRSRFDFRRFLIGRRMRYIVFVNPRVFEADAPAAGIRAIVAHELAHVLYYRSRHRLRLLGLVRLAGSGYRVRFERWADMQALSRGYGEGLAAYRDWLYRHVPASKLEAKRRDYFSPEEIHAIDTAARTRPALYEYWLDHIPRNIDEISRATHGNAP